MTKSRIAFIFAAGVVAATLSACQSTQQILANEEKIAMEAAVKRGQFEMSCPAATGTVLSSDMLQPVLWRGTERAEYQIGVAGCNKRSTYVVVCPLDSSSCLAASGEDNVTTD